MRRILWNVQGDAAAEELARMLSEDDWRILSQLVCTSVNSISDERE